MRGTSRALWKYLLPVLALSLLLLPANAGRAQTEDERPNLLLLISDDQSYPHASAYGNSVVETPGFDRVARQGALFSRAFVSAPSCTPSRGAILTGQDAWRLEQGANLWSALPAGFAVYPELLEEAGYFVGYAEKGRKPPATNDPPHRERNAAGPEFASFQEFLQERPTDQPFSFWYGSGYPHRSYEEGIGRQSGMKIEEVDVPGFLPDTPTVRSDLLDYYHAIEQFDRRVQEILRVLEESGELEHTIVAVTSDNGMPFPRAKANLYDAGTRVPLAMMGPGIEAGQKVDAFINLKALAPTFLDAAGAQPPEQMNSRSFLSLLHPGGEAQSNRDFVVTGRERHAWVRENGLGYPSRAIRTEDYLYIVNFRPGRWPAGHPDARYDTNEHGYGDIDASPTKRFMRDYKGEYPELFEKGFGKRPAEELYALDEAPDQLHNVADSARYAEVKARMRRHLTEYLKESGDPRVLDGTQASFDDYPYYGDKSPHARASRH